MDKDIIEIDGKPIATTIINMHPYIKNTMYITEYRWYDVLDSDGDVYGWWGIWLTRFHYGEEA